MDVVRKFVLSKITDKRLQTPPRIDASSGHPRFLVDIYDMDGQQVVSTLDFVADVLVPALNKPSLEQFCAQVAYDINHLPQPA